MTTTYTQQLDYLRLIQSRQSHVHMKAVAEGKLSAEQAAHEAACLADAISHLEMLIGCGECGEGFSVK